MNDKKLLLGFAAVVFLLTTLSGISSFVVSALCAIMAILVAMAAIAAIKAAVVAAKTAITGSLSMKEENRKIAMAGRIAALGIAVMGIAAAALAVFTATSMGTAGIFAIPMITALYLYNYKKEEAVVEKETTVESNNNETVIGNETSESAEVGIKEVCCQLISSALTDVNDNLLYGLGDGIGNYTHSLYNKMQPIFARVPSRAQA
ncbi:MAG: hypothetical protein U0X86_001269 [Wolbachia endosymbiont of Xenopsylla cheopis]